MYFRACTNKLLPKVKPTLRKNFASCKFAMTDNNNCLSSNFAAQVNSRQISSIHSRYFGSIVADAAGLYSGEESNLWSITTRSLTERRLITIIKVARFCSCKLRDCSENFSFRLKFEYKELYNYRTELRKDFILF